MSPPIAPKPARAAHSTAAPAPTPLIQRAVANSLAAVFLISLAFGGIRAAVNQLRGSLHFYQSHNRPIPVEVERAAAYVQSQIPPASPVLLVVSKPDAWADGLWSRALYPNPIFLVYKQDLDTPDHHELRRKYRVRFAVSIGDPPLDPGFRWQKPAPGWTGAGQVAFGEVKP